MAKALINGITVHYQQAGAGEPLVLVHGITSCLAQWYYKLMPELAKNYHVTVYDLRGHGLTQITEHGYDSRTMALDLLGLMDHLGIERASMVGHSFGGPIALHLAMMHPERVKSVVLLDSGFACLRHLRLIENWPGWKTHGKILAKFGITLDRFLDVDRKQDVSEIIRKSLTIPLQAGFRRGKTPMTPRIKKLVDETKMCSEFREIGELTENRLAEIQIPVYALYGGTSPYEPMAAHLSRIMPHCRHESLEGVDHFYAIEEPDLALPRLRAFLADPNAFLATLEQAAVPAG